jgi:hypothetical protein
MSDERNEPRFGRRKRWHDLSGELHPLMALAIAFLFLAGIPILADAIAPLTRAASRWLFG